MKVEPYAFASVCLFTSWIQTRVLGRAKISVKCIYGNPLVSNQSTLWRMYPRLRKISYLVQRLMRLLVLSSWLNPFPVRGRVSCYRSPHIYSTDSLSLVFQSTSVSPNNSRTCTKFGKPCTSSPSYDDLLDGLPFPYRSSLLSSDYSSTSTSLIFSSGSPSTSSSAKSTSYLTISLLVSVPLLISYPDNSSTSLTLFELRSAE